jgi:hypothetical protein
MTNGLRELVDQVYVLVGRYVCGGNAKEWLCPAGQQGRSHQGRTWTYMVYIFRRSVPPHISALMSRIRSNKLFKML